VTETRLRPKVVLWWGIGLSVAGVLLTTFLPQIGYFAGRPVNADPFSRLALTVVLVAAGLYAGYWVVRRAVAGGIRDAGGGRRRSDLGPE
jgi:drug/metabolite transporter (DMT)-like permease